MLASYLTATLPHLYPTQAIVDAAVSTGAQAVHPGYGFLSENCKFAQLLEQNGIAFIGPKEKAIEVGIMFACTADNKLVWIEI